MARVVSDGQSVRVTVPSGTAFAVNAGDFALFDGWFGWAFQGAPAAGAANVDIALRIDQCEYETSQITIADAFAKGALVYWVAATRLLTTASNAGANRLVGKVTQVKDTNNVIWFIMVPPTA